MKHIAVVLFAAAISLFVAGAWLWLIPTTLPREVAVAPADDFPNALPVGRTIISFRIANPTRAPARILGLQEGWGLNCCFSSKHHELIIVDPGETFHYRCELIVHQAGPFSASIGLWVYDQNLRLIELTVNGTGVEKIHVHYDQK